MTNQTKLQLPLVLFTMFWAAQTVSLFGDRLNNFSLMALINSFAANPSLTLAQLYLAMSLPTYLLAPIIGAFVDRLNKRWVLVFTDLTRGMLVLLIPLLFGRTHEFFPVLVVVFLLSTGNTFFLPAKSALIPELVSYDQLMHVNSILWAAGIAGVIGGFLGGGFIYDFLSWRACFWLDAASYFISASLLLGIAVHHYRSTAGAPKEKAYHPELPKAILDGVRVARSTPAIIRPIGVQMLIWLGAGGFSVLTLPLVKQVSPGSSMGLSMLGLALGVGMGLGSFLASRVHLGDRSRERLEMLLFGAITAGAAVLAAGRTLAGILPGAFIGGFAATPLLIIAESEIQHESHESMRGRVFAFREICTRTFFIGSSFAFSALSSRVSQRVVLLALGVFLAISGILWIGIVSRRLRPRAGVRADS